MRYFLLITIVMLSGSLLAQQPNFFKPDYTAMMIESDSILGKDSSDCISRFNRSLALQHFNRYPEAIRDINYIIEVCREFNHTSYYSRGNTYKKWGNYDYALKDYIKALSLQDSIKVVWDDFFQIGFCCAKLGRNNEALDWYNKAIEREPNEGIVYYNLGLVYNNLSNDNRACFNLKKALNLGILDARQVLEDICK